MAENVNSDKFNLSVENNLTPAYTVSLEFSVKDESTQVHHKHLILAMIDSGSPISLIKSKYIPTNAISHVSDKNEFYGINNFELNVLGLFKNNFEIENIGLDFSFLVVPDDTMKFPALLGRDFTSRNDMKNIVKKALNLEYDNNINFLRELMAIDYLQSPCNVSEQLNVNPNVAYVLQKEIKNLYQNDYSIKLTGEKLIDPPEMNITLKNEQPINFRPRRLYFF